MSKDDSSIDEFEAWLKAEKHKAIDARNGGLLIVRTGTWVDAFETFRKEYKPKIKPNIKSKVIRVLKKALGVRNCGPGGDM